MNEDIELSLDFKALGDAEVTFFTQIVLTRMVDVPAYAFAKPRLDNLKIVLAAFMKAASDAINGGDALLEARTAARGLLDAELVLLGNEILAFNPDPLFLVAAGFQGRKKTSTQSRVPFEIPMIVSLVRGVLKGTVKGEVKKLPKGAKGVIPLWRVTGDKKLPFIQGRPSTGKRFDLDGLPSLTEIEVCVRYYGTHGRESSDCKPMPIDVL